MIFFLTKPGYSFWNLWRNRVVYIDETGQFHFDMTHFFRSIHRDTIMEMLIITKFAISVSISIFPYLSFRTMWTISWEIKQFRGKVHSIRHFDMHFDLFLR